jgi:hypothetical protein
MKQAVVFASTGLLRGFPFDREDDGDMFFQKVG